MPSVRRTMLKVKRRLQLRADPVGFAKGLGVSVGEHCRLLGVSASTFGSEPYLVSLGEHVTVTGGVRFVTHDGGVWVFRGERPTIDVIAPIRVGNNVFIGLNSILLPGVTVGDDVVVAAGSVVTRDVPSKSVVGGVPAKQITTIDEYRTRAFAQSVDLKGLSPDQKRKLLLQRFPPSPGGNDS